ncbi:MAG: hypothetical protein IKU48_01520 [Clostridia bacterium]|nr:hypothetical protein [Clostridia bacterium]
MKNSIILPSAIQICVDDVGWFTGEDARYAGKPSRTGMVRNHVPEDYIALNEIGKAIGQKLICPIVLGEWDKDNLLRGEIGITYQPNTWDRASTLNMKLAEKCFEAAESSEFIEYAYHGVLHGNYDEKGRQITEEECFTYPADSGKSYFHTGKATVQPEEEIAHRFELFYKIYDSWGFKKKIRTHTAPNSVPRTITSEEVLPLAHVINKHNISYWVNGWKGINGHMEFIDGILYMEKGTNTKIPWNACDVDPLLLADCAKEGDERLGTIINSHWPNYLRFHKEHNLERVENWKKFFERQSEIFGLMVSKDVAFAGNQCIYRNYSKIETEKNVIKIDVTNAATISPKHTFGEFYVSLKNNLVPKEIKGGTFEVYETHKEFKTYKIKHTENIVEITLY